MPHEGLDRRYAEPSPLDPRGDDDRPCADLAAVEQSHHPMLPAALEGNHLLGEDDVGTHQPRLLAGSLHEIAPVDAVGKPRVVADERARPRLATRDRLLEEHGIEALGRGVHGGGQPGRTCSHDGELTCVDVVVDPDADHASEIWQARVHGDLPVVADHDGQPRAVDTCLVEELTTGLALQGVEAEGEVEACQHVAQLEHTAVTLLGHDAEELEVRLLFLHPG